MTRAQPSTPPPNLASQPVASHAEDRIYPALSIREFCKKDQQSLYTPQKRNHSYVLVMNVLNEREDSESLSGLKVQLKVSGPKSIFVHLLVWALFLVVGWGSSDCARV